MNAGSSNDPPQQWSVQAQFTISHPGVDDPNNAPQTRTEYDNNGVHMFYSWNSQPNRVVGTNEPNRLSKDSNQAYPSPYKFQKGSLLFTSEPPKKNLSSGYGSDLFSPNSSLGTSVPRKSMQPYGQKCRSTCSIVLSTTINEQPEFEEKDSTSSHCDRTQSLRCQIPTTDLENPTTFYGCGDPWCYHHADSVKRPSRASTFSPPCFENRLKDAAVQTFEMVDKCTSPFLKSEESLFKKKRVYSRSKTEPVTRKSSQSSFTPDSLENYKLGQHLIGTQASYLTNRKSSGSDSKSNDPNKKPRTVHIDVYCTGTEQESDSNSSSEKESKTASSPQTVFESEKLKVTHARSGDGNLPLKLQESDSTKGVTSATKPENDSDNDDNTSTAYPSQISSYSALAGLSSFASTIPPSWSTYSFDGSVANTSWKDTFSDIDSLIPSRSSIALTDSLEFVPRKSILTQKSESIEEHPETLEAPSLASLNPSDSFEYENSEDRLRIKQKEKAWNKPTTYFKSPHLERSKHLLQQQKLKEYVEKRLSGIKLQQTESKDSDSGSDVSEKGYSFIKNEDKEHQKINNKHEIQYSCKRSPSVMVLQAKLSLNPNLQAPFMIDPGIYTKQRNVAKKFGSVIDVFRKPGHHIGPAKNPECQCDHCRLHYQSGMRGRTQSAGEIYPPWMNWKKNLKQLQFQEEPVMK